MKVIIQNSRRYVLRFDRGEELIASLAGFLEQENITASTIAAIGTCSEVELGFYHKEAREYEKHQIHEDLEVLSLVGNSGIMNGKPAVHLHGSFSKSDLSAIGGHVFSLIVAATVELNLIKLKGQIERKPNPEFNLNLLG